MIKNRTVKKNRSKQIFFLISYKLKACFSKKFRHPLICSFKITRKCNLKCLHCPFWRRDYLKDDSCSNLEIRDDAICNDSLSFDKIKSILNDLYLEGVKIIIFEGGEPLLWKDPEGKKDIKDIISYSKKFFYYTGITTNGTINFKDINPDILFISIDGLKETHERIRGKGSFDMIIKNILSNRGKKIIANVCISRANIKEVPDLIIFLNEKVYGITVQFFYPYENLPDLFLRKEERSGIIDKLLELKNNNYKILNSAASLVKMKDNSWKCSDFLVANVESNGKITRGCYLKDKVKDVSCKACGFAVHCEISLAYALNMSSINAARKIFWQ